MGPIVFVRLTRWPCFVSLIYKINMMKQANVMATSTKLNGTLRAFIERQHVFFVATAAKDGRVNVSPKGMNTLRIMDDNRIVWLNLSGSGNETAAHLLDTPRMTLMFCAFEGDPLILRTYGTAKAIHERDPEWGAFVDMFPKLAGTRQFFDMQIDLVQSSCGTAVPVMDYSHGRGEVDLVPYFENLGEEGTMKFWQKKNTVSIDGKPTGLFEDG